MAKLYEYILLLIVSCLYFGSTTANVCRKDISTKGRHFVVTQPPIVSDVEFSGVLYLSSEGYGQASIIKHISGVSNMIRNYSLTPGVVPFNFSGRSIRQFSQGIQTKALEIVSTTDITVLVAGTVPNTAAAYVVFPIETLSDHYVIATYKTIFSNEYNYLLVTSLNNDTRISISNYQQNNVTNVTINKLESYTLRTLYTGSFGTVSSSKPVNVVVGNMCTRVPTDIGNCDTIYDSPVPVTFWGQQFIIPPLKPKSGCLVRLYPKTEKTVVNIKYFNSTTHKNASFKGMHELILGTEPTAIVSDQPINIVQYSFTGEYDGTEGDTFMTSVPAVKHFSHDYLFPTPLQGEHFTYRAAITVMSRYVHGLLLDGNNVTTLNHIGKWTVNAPFDSFTVIALDISPGNHTLRHQSSDARFSVLLYGLKSMYGFGLYLGFSFPIEEHKCENGGSCSTEGTCACQTGFTGDSCEYNIDDCSSFPCKNGATCVDGISDYTCICNIGYTGTNCETDIDDCSTFPCRNGATCVDGISDYTCICNIGNTGTNCETDIDECSSDPCMNGASCFDGISSYTCMCNIGFTGQHCETDIDECSSVPCMNGATCFEGISSYTCMCNIGYTGQNCGTVLQTKNLVCFSCDYTSAPSYCDNIEYCSGDKMCFIERLTHSQGYQYYKSGCKDRQVCSQESQADAQSAKSCLKCCDGSFCNSQGCGDQGLPPAGTRGPLCLDCSFVSDPKLCHKVAFCSSDEKCHIEEVEWGSNFIYHLGCKSSHECAFEASTRMVSPNTMTSRSLPACAMCCDADFCNRNCTKHDTDNQQAIIG